jgi:hypothetical protein
VYCSTSPDPSFEAKPAISVRHSPSRAPGTPS